MDAPDELHVPTFLSNPNSVDLSFAHPTFRSVHFISPFEELISWRPLPFVVVSEPLFPPFDSLNDLVFGSASLLARDCRFLLLSFSFS